MTIEEIIQKRNISEVLHFTTHRGITGILHTGAVKARNLLPRDKRLEYVYLYNCPDRSRDIAWWNFINLSITSVNRRLFGIAAGNWHSNDDGWWCILSFDPLICSHEGVYFTTTNNMYSGVKRLKGSAGLEALFAPRITQWNGKIINRAIDINDNQPTCQQAEVLYPIEISLSFLKKVYVKNNDDASKFDSIKKFYNDWKEVPVEVDEQLFI